LFLVIISVPNAGVEKGRGMIVVVSVKRRGREQGGGALVMLRFSLVLSLSSELGVALAGQDEALVDF